MEGRKSDHSITSVIQVGSDRHQTRVIEMKRKGWDNRGVGPQRVPDGTWGEGHGEVFEPSGTETRNT